MAIHMPIKLQLDADADGAVLLLGLGYSALALLPILRAAGVSVFATSRNASQMDAIRDFGITPLLMDGTLHNDMRAALSSATTILSSIPPTKDGIDPVMAMMGGEDIPALAPRLRWAGYLSATSVYGDRAGHWAFEDEMLRPTTTRGRARVEAELAWLESGWPVHVFRLAGIYGPELAGPLGPVSRNPFAKLMDGTARAIIKDGHIVNRIHVQDIATALTASINRPDPCSVYNIADGHPAPPQDVLHYAADIAGLPRAAETDLLDPALSSMVRSFYAECKAVDISRARERLRWSPEFGDYRAGLDHIYAQDFGDRS